MVVAMLVTLSNLIMTTNREITNFGPSCLSQQRLGSGSEAGCKRIQVTSSSREGPALQSTSRINGTVRAGKRGGWKIE